METKCYLFEEKINLNEFKEKYFKNLSKYFIDIFSEYIKNLKIFKSKEENKKNIGIMEFDISIDERGSNPLMIAHGGAIATLFEDLSKVCLLYFTNQDYQTIDISINYKNQVELGKIYKLVITCTKLKAKTIFVEAELKKENEIGASASASMIKVLLKPLF